MSSILGFELPKMDDNDWKWVEGAGTLLGGVANIWNSSQVNKNYETMNDLYAQDRARNIQRQEQTEDNLEEGINAGFQLNKKKES